MTTNNISRYNGNSNGNNSIITSSGDASSDNNKTTFKRNKQRRHEVGKISSRGRPCCRHRQRNNNNILLKSIIVFAVCWIQITVNVFTYFISNSSNSSSNNNRNRNLLRGSGGGDKINNSSDHDIEQYQKQSQQQQQQQQQPISLENQLMQLQSRMQQLMEQQQEEEESAEENTVYDNTNTSVKIITTTNTNRSKKEKRKVVFVPFTIRDAQRTVPTQIPHGFHIFDYINLYASETDGDQIQNTTAFTTKTKAKLYHNGKPIKIHFRPHSSALSTPALASSSSASFTEQNLPECREYSRKCYRTKMLQVLHYLLSIEKKSSSLSKRKQNDDSTSKDDGHDYHYEYFYFYMEADNDLCVSLDDIKNLALKYRRYFINTGEGIGSASGWIMSQQFVHDFYYLWSNRSSSWNDSDSITTHNNNYNIPELLSSLTDEEKLEPNSVASILLKWNKNWSVTRRYLTSHSILVGNTNDTSSISDLYIRSDDDNVDNERSNATNSTIKAAAVVDIHIHKSTDGNEKKPDSAFGQLEKLTQKKLVAPSSKSKDDDKQLSTSFSMEPARYLPRCLEPHRGIWPDKEGTKLKDGDDNNVNKNDNKEKEENSANHSKRDNNNKDSSNVATDIYHWDFFDYNLCPESDIFPCKEGQLE